jgi:hypothetical protein
MKRFFSVTLALLLFLICKAQPSTQTIVVTFSQTPTSASSVFAPAKYNKEAVFQMEFDDRSSQFRDVFAYMNGGKASDSIVYPGQTYTDGCGNPVNFRAGIACNAYPSGYTKDWQYFGASASWSEIRN